MERTQVTDGVDGPVNARRRGYDCEEIGGDPACWLGMLCPACGAVMEGENAHRPGCANGDGREAAD